MASRRIRLDNPEDWPADLADHVFIGRALDALGAASFHDDWALGDLFANDHLRLGELWNREHGFAKVRAEQYDEYQALKTNLLAAEARIDAVQQKAFQGFVSGRLTGVYRAPNGQILVLDPDDWTHLNWRELLISFHREVVDEYGAPVAYCPLFVRRKGLERKLRNLRLHLADDVDYSPPLRAMLAVARQIDREGPVPAAELVAALRLEWSGDEPLSDDLAALMADMVLGRAMRSAAI